jgi:multicomponent Na+:H+ antiporter subunit F
MIPPGAGPAAATAWLMLAVLAVALLLSFIRLVRGPTLPDRVVALDVAATLIVGMIGAYAVAQSQPVLLRVAMTVTLFNFIGTVAFAWYLQRRAKS